MSKKKVLFVSHDASQTGAPIVLLHLLKWLKKHNIYDISILLQNSGPLLDSFQEIGLTYIMVKQDNEYVGNFLERLTGRVRKKNELSPFPVELKYQTFDLIYLNTSVALTIANDLKTFFNCPVICHIHENEYALNILFSKGFPEQHVKAIDRFIAVSNSTKRNLIESYGIEEDKIDLVYEFISIKEKQKSLIKKEIILKELNIENKLIVGGSGSTNWRKGVDLFIQLGFWINNLRPNNHIRLIWLGSISPEFKQQYAYEAKRLQISESVLFIGSKENSQDYFQVFDIFALTSREDPFPLVVLEAAAFYKPIVFFDHSGGIPELIVNDKGGIKVPYGDVIKMANAILQLADNNKLREQKGNEAAQLVKDYDVEVISKQIVNVMDTLLKSN